MLDAAGALFVTDKGLTVDESGQTGHKMTAMGAHGPTDVLAGVVLGSRNVGESHRVIEIFCQNTGRQEVWARGGRASRKRFVGASEPFASVSLEVSHGRMGWAATGAQVLTPRPLLRGHLVSLGRAAALCRLVSLLWPLGQPAPHLGGGLVCALDHLEAGRWARATGLYPRLLLWSGLISVPPACCLCGNQSARALCEAPAAQGPVCLSCRPTARPLGQAMIAALSGESVGDDALAHRLERLVVGWAEWHVGRHLPLLHHVRPEKMACRTAPSQVDEALLAPRT